METLEELQTALDKAKKQLKAAGSPDEKTFAENKIKNIEAKIRLENRYEGTPHADAGKKPEPPKTIKKKASNKAKKPEPKKTGKIKPPIKSKKKYEVEYKGKTYNSDDSEFCSILAKKLEERVEARAKAKGKHKTESVSMRIGNNVAHAVSKAIHSVDKDDIKKSPDKYIKKFENLEKSANQFITDFKSVLGEDYDSEDIREPMELIEQMIADIKEKVKNKK